MDIPLVHPIDARDDRIDMLSAYSVAQWTQILDVTVGQLAASVIAVGNRARAVKEDLRDVRGKPGAPLEQ
jgi:Protein of unknown function (DUF3606)